MATLSELIGFSPSQGGTYASTSKFTGTSLATDPNLNPDDYPNLASSARSMGVDVRTAYIEALEEKQREEREQDRYYLDRAKEFVELSEQVETSTGLLNDLSTFLSTFQKDLSAVSGHIAELQGRSKTIEGRLEARKAVERSLHPYLESITVSPALIHTIVETPVNHDWIMAITELDEKLGAIRSGPRIEGRKSLDEIAEALRLAAAQKILNHLISLIKPFTASIASPLASLQTHTLLPLKPLFDFLRRHAARQAHEFQKAYIATIRWYYETAFRRYVRALEKTRVKGVEKIEPIGVVTAGADGGLSLLAKRPTGTSTMTNGGGAGGAGEMGSRSAIVHSKIDGGPAIMTVASIETKWVTNRPTPEALFRSASLVMADNASTEYSFVSAFFGTHSSLNVTEPRTPSLFSSETGSASRAAGGAEGEETSTASWTSAGIGGGGGGEKGSGKPGEDGLASLVDLADKSDSGLSMSTTAAIVAREEKTGKLKRAVVEGIWKSIMEPAQEYTRNFISALLDPLNPPSPLSILSMIRLNDSIIQRLVSSANTEHDLLEPSCPAMESHLISIRMQLWPLLSKSINLQIDSIKKINGTPLASGGVFGGSKAGPGVKDSIVRIVVGRYAELFNTCLQLIKIDSGSGSGMGMSGEGEEEMVFGQILRLRSELDKLLVFQSEKIPDEPKRKGFLDAHYGELVSLLSTGSRTSHSRSQAEVAHYRELARKLRAR